MSIRTSFNPLGTLGTSPLPPGYKKLSYLQSTDGLQSMSTGFMPSAALRWVFEFQTVEREGDAWSNGCYDARFSVAKRTMFAETGDKLFYRARMYDEVDDSVWITPARTRVLGDLNYPAGYKELNNQRVYVSGSNYAPAFIDLFVRRAPNGILRNGSVRVFRSDIYIDGVLTQKLRPALDPNERPCMFDFVSGEPFYNDGTGEFVYA